MVSLIPWHQKTSKKDAAAIVKKHLPSHEVDLCPGKSSTCHKKPPKISKVGDCINAVLNRSIASYYTLPLFYGPLAVGLLGLYYNSWLSI